MGIIMKDGHQYGVGGLERAEDISYDNTDSGMTATNVQEAVDELNAGLNGVKIQHGTVTVTTSNTQVSLPVMTGYLGQTSVVFATPFSSNPVVCLSTDSDVNAGYWNITPNKVTTTGFDATCVGNTANKTITFSWVAFGF